MDNTMNNGKDELNKPLHFDAVLKEVPFESGILYEDVVKMYENLKGTEMLPISVQGVSSEAIGFINFQSAELVGFDYSDIEESLEPVLSDMDLEKADGIYTVDTRNGDKLLIQLYR